MLDFWLKAITPALIAGVIGLLLWAIFSPLVGLIFMVFILIGLFARHAHHLYQLSMWLAKPDLQTIPSAYGIWDDALSRLYKMVKRHQQTKLDLAAELQHIELATSALPDGVAILNAGNRIEWCNPVAAQHFGLIAQHDIMQDITYLVRQPDFIEYLQAANFSEPLVMSPARQSELRLSIKLIDYGDNKRLLISRDITQLERIEAMRRDFVANVSHELRTPLTVVHGYVENLQDMETLNHTQISRALFLMSEQTHRMDNLVADLLTLSRLESDVSPISERLINITSLVDEIYRDGLSLSEDRHQITVEISSRKNLVGNYEDLRSAFSNLLSNAIRYTPANGGILVRWSERGEQVIFSVQDSGIGIAAQHIPRLTERFYRVDRSRSRETGGTGLGLAIVKHIALRHQANLEITSLENQGSTFALVFPPRRGQFNAA
jgi:two-component system, OmpR family, phosphate regulon sensor histidine kinase PhoR